MKKPSTRRRFLRGLGGLGLALPFLELYQPKTAHAAPPPKRYAFLFAGMSIGSYGNDRMAPAAEGPLASNLTRGLAPLGELGVADVVSMVSGLSIPASSSVPTAGRPTSFHSTSHQVLATGQRFDVERYGELPGPSSDWIVAQKIGQGTLQPNLVYRAQPSFYRVGSADGGTDGVISARINASGELEQVHPLTSPRVAYEALFSGFVPPDPEIAEEAKRLLRMRKSIVDLVSDDTAALMPKLGSADRQRMQRHFDELRALETRLEATELPDTAACKLLEHPGSDPPIGDAIDPSGEGDYNSHYMNANGYSNEEHRAELMVDLIHMAFACDISRVSSFMLTHAQCFMNMYTLLGHASDLHEISHGSIGDNEAEMQDALADCAAWHVKHFGRLVKKLRDTEDVDGSNLLDNTALALAFEGGWGYDPEAGLEFSAHSTENMVMLVAGKAGGLNATEGRHIKAQGVHPTAVLNTCMSAVGVDETLGQVSDTVDELFG